MGKIRHPEATFFLTIATVLIALAGMAQRFHHDQANGRVAYGVQHLGSALLLAGVFFGFVGFGYVWLRRHDVAWLESRPTAWFIGLVAAVFCLFWLPVLLGSGFVQDDWLLLAAAAVRRVVPVHPSVSWVALDTVDGNFRPLGTVLYFGYLYRMVGFSPHIFLMGNFALSLAAAVMGFLVVRELGYSKVTAAVGATLYLSRGLLYTQVAWISALGDCIVTLLTAMVVWLVLRAMRQEGRSAWLLHVAAWALFAVSTLAKQSSFTTPALVTAMLLIRPGAGNLVAWKRRWMEAASAAAAYGSVVVAIYLHARSLLGDQTPYRVGLTLFGALRTFAYVFWYFETLYVPSSKLVARSHPAGLFDLGGLLLVLAIGVLLYRHRRLMGERPRDLLFLGTAGLVSVSLFVLLEGRNEAYYGAMLAFWFSLGFAILLTRVKSPGPRRLAAFLFCGLVALGSLDVRLKEIGLVWTGGYFWGDADVHDEKIRFKELQEIVGERRGGETAVLIDPPIQTRFYTAMLWLINPRLGHVLVYDSRTNSYLGNNREGRPPEDGVSALRDVGAYSARTPLQMETASDLISGAPTIWIRYERGSFAEIGRNAVEAKMNAKMRP